MCVFRTNDFKIEINTFYKFDANEALFALTWISSTETLC